MRDTVTVEELLGEHRRYIRGLVDKFQGHYPMADQDRIDSAVMLGAWEAIRGWNGAGSLTGYMHWIVEKRVLDDVREQGPMSRAEGVARRKGLEVWGSKGQNRVRDLSEAVHSSLDAALTADNDSSIATYLGVDEPGYEEFIDDEFWSLAMARLPVRERFVVYLHYFEGVCLREIGEMLGVTESRASQLNTKALYRLRYCEEIRSLVA